MPGFATADLLRKPPFELALRSGFAFGMAVWLVMRLAPVLLEPLLHYFETVVHLLDEHYWIDFSLSYQTGHDRLGSELSLLGRASVMVPFTVSAGNTVIALTPGQALKCSTAIGVLMQPVIMIVGILTAWPLYGLKGLPLRIALATVAQGFWVLVGIPLSLWLYFQEIPIRVIAPDIILFETIAGRFLLNGGSLLLGALMAVGVIALESRWKSSN